MGFDARRIVEMIRTQTINEQLVLVPWCLATRLDVIVPRGCPLWAIWFVVVI